MLSLDEIKYGTANYDQLPFLNSQSHLDGLFAELTHYAPPANSSPDTKAELNSLAEMTQELAKLGEENIAVQREYYFEPFERFLKVKPELIQGIHAIVDPLVWKLKYYFQRPRPQQLAYYYNLKMFPLTITDSPSYPSLSVVRAAVISEVLINKFPQHKKKVSDIKEHLSISRMMLGANYQSDVDMAIVVGHKICKDPEFQFRFRM